MASALPHEIPSYIRAATPKKLRLVMIRNNAKYKTTFQYFDIQFVKGYWFAWFYVAIRHDDEVLNGS